MKFILGILHIIGATLGFIAGLLMLPQEMLKEKNHDPKELYKDREPFEF